MKIKNVPGEYGFKALYTQSLTSHEWFLSDSYFFSYEDAINTNKKLVKWPVEIDENGSIYIPDKSEYE